MKLGSHWLGVAVGALLVAAVAIAVYALVARAHAPARDDELASAGRAGPGGDTVILEFRAKPVARIRLAGKLLGATPLAIHVPRAGAPVMVEAQFAGAQVVSRQVVPDHDQAIELVAPR